MDWQKIVEQGNECHRKTVANKESWLVVPNILKMTDEERIAFFKKRTERRHKFMTINVSTWHMAIFQSSTKTWMRSMQVLFND
jgi:GTPase involved in cell partitioning and DNA repair